MPIDPVVKRGDIFDVDWGEQSGLHPALIIQNDIGNERSNSTIVAYISHTIKDYPVLVSFKEHESSLKDGGAVNLGRIMTIPKTLLKCKRGHLSSKKMPQINEAIKVSLGLE
jgi:mRNA interferase MazF